MSGIIAILLFSFSLILCLIFNYSVVYALIIGYFIFMGYGIFYGYKLKKLFLISIRSSLQVKNIIIIFILIGLITAFWRASGTIAIIIELGSKLIVPQGFILLSFLLCAILSSLIGSALGTSATMGVICITIARAMNIEELYVAGAILSGIYFGDRCSPMATSAHLVSELTNTNLYENIKKMISTSIVPFILTCVIYLLLGISLKSEIKSIEIIKIFRENYNLNLITLIPAIIIVVFSILKINVKITMFLSVLTAFFIAKIYQNESFVDLYKYSLYGYETSNIILNKMMSGGGIISMINVSLIVGISSSYSGIFEETKMLENLKKYILILTKKINAFGSILVVSIISSAIACNQSLGIILTNQLTNNIMKDKERAIALENTVVVVAGLIPWSIAMAVPLDAINVSSISGVFAIYIFLVPIYNYIKYSKNHK